MGIEGKQNTLMAIKGLIAAFSDIRDDVIRARADGVITKEEALGLIEELAIAIIKEGLPIALEMAMKAASTA